MHVVRQREGASPARPQGEGWAIDSLEQPFALEPFGKVNEADILDRPGEGARHGLALGLDEIGDGCAGGEGRDEPALDRMVMDERDVEVVAWIRVRGVPRRRRGLVGRGVGWTEEPEVASLSLRYGPEQINQAGDHRRDNHQPRAEGEEVGGTQRTHETRWRWGAVWAATIEPPVNLECGASAPLLTCRLAGTHRKG